MLFSFNRFQLETSLESFLTLSTYFCDNCVLNIAENIFAIVKKTARMQSKHLKCAFSKRKTHASNYVPNFTSRNQFLGNIILRQQNKIMMHRGIFYLSSGTRLVQELILAVSPLGILKRIKNLRPRTVLHIVEALFKAAVILTSSKKRKKFCKISTT
jgi:hypothetical protein